MEHTEHTTITSAAQMLIRAYRAEAQTAQRELDRLRKLKFAKLYQSHTSMRVRIETLEEAAKLAEMMTSSGKEIAWAIRQLKAEEQARKALSLIKGP